jgi:hypothetical protein
VKNVAKLRSGSLIIECFRKQQSLNLVALKDINGISVSITDHHDITEILLNVALSTINKQSKAKIYNE